MTEQSRHQEVGFTFLLGERANRISLHSTVRGGFESVPVTQVSLEPDWVGSDRATEGAWAQRWSDLKEERNGLGALFTEQIWRKVGDIRRKVIQKGRPMGLLSGIADSPVDDNPAPLWKRPGGISPTPDDLRRASITTFNAGLQEWKRERDERLALPPEQWTLEDEKYDRLNNIILFGQLTGQIKSASIRDAASFITSGVGTAMETEWGLFEVAPKVFERKYGEAPTREDMDELIQTTHLILPLAAGHEELATGFFDFLRGFGPSEHREYSEPFLEEYFDIVEEGEENSSELTRRLVITDAAKRRFIEAVTPDPEHPGQIPLSSKTTGCLALQAKGEGFSTDPDDAVVVAAKSVVIENHEFSVSAARDYYLPQFAEAA